MSALPCILIVDDVAENITTMAGALRPHYRVLCATNGADALRLLQEQVVDLVLLDVMMPDMDGYAVCSQLKEHWTWRDIPVIFVSALGEPGDEARGLALGAADFLHKPCHPEIIRLRVQMHLERRHQERQLQRLVRERTVELDETRAEITKRLARAAEYRDNETGLHVTRVANSVCLLARAIGVPQDLVELLALAAPLHDIGKIAIPDNILLKPGRLSPEEFEVIKTHTLVGAEIVGHHASALIQLARTVCLTHHERWDRSGLPPRFARRSHSNGRSHHRHRRRLRRLDQPAPLQESLVTRRRTAVRPGAGRHWFRPRSGGGIRPHRATD